MGVMVANRKIQDDLVSAQVKKEIAVIESNALDEYLKEEEAETELRRRREWFYIIWQSK